MRRDHRPFYLKRLHERFERAWTHRFVRPQLDALGGGFKIMKPWNLSLHGPNIRFGDHVHVVTARDRRVCLSVWELQGQVGAIDIGDYALICPGVRIDSASGIRIGQGAMIAAGAYLTDADWHDLYDRTRPIGATREIVLEDNVWIGDGATICKGVTIGRNAVVAAGAVVARDVPADTVVAGNPAVPVKVLDDPGRRLISRAAMFADPEGAERFLEDLDRYLLGRNRTLRWLRTRISPRPGE